MANPNISRIFGSAGFLKIRLWCLFEYDDELWAALCVEMLTWVWRTARRCMMTNPRASPTATRSSMPCSFLPHFTSWWHWHTGTSKSWQKILLVCYYYFYVIWHLLALLLVKVHTYPFIDVWQPSTGLHICSSHIDIHAYTENEI